MLDIHLDVFAEVQSGLYRRIEEDQRQRAHTVEELRAALTNANFSDIHIYGDRTYAEPRADTPRWHITAQRSREP